MNNTTSRSPTSWDEDFSRQYDQWSAHMSEDIAFYVELACQAPAAPAHLGRPPSYLRTGRRVAAAQRTVRLERVRLRPPGSRCGLMALIRTSLSRILFVTRSVRTGSILPLIREGLAPCGGPPRMNGSGSSTLRAFRWRRCTAALPANLLGMTARSMCSLQSQPHEPQPEGDLRGRHNQRLNAAFLGIAAHSQSFRATPGVPVLACLRADVSVAFSKGPLGSLERLNSAVRHRQTNVELK